MSYYPDDAPWHVRLVRQLLRAWSGLTRIGEILVWPVEVAIAFFARLLMVSGGHGDAGESILFRLLFAPLRWIGHGLRLVQAGVSWPFRKLFPSAVDAQLGEPVDAPGVLTRAWWSLATWWQRVTSEPTGWLGRLITVPVIAAARVSRSAVRVFLRLAEALNLNIYVKRLVRWTRPLWYPFAALGGFVIAWFVTRSRRRLAWGLPLLLVLAPAAWITVERVLWGQTRVVEQYRLAVTTAREEKAYDRMQLFERKLAQLGVNTDLTTFNIAMELARTGDIANAYERMRAIAPADRPGFANAHAWIIQNILGNTIHLPAEEGRALVTAHLAQLESLGIKSADFDLLRGYCAAYCGRSAEAAALLKPFVDTNPTAAVECLQLDLSLKRADAARQDAKIVEDFMQRSKQTGQSLTSHDYRWWCIAENTLGHQARLHDTLKEWRKLDPHNQDAGEMASQVFLAELRQMLANPAAKPNEMVIAIRDLIAAGTDTSEAENQIFTMYRSRRTNPTVNAAFESLVQTGDMSPLEASVLGTAAAADDNWDTARSLLEQAVRAAPDQAKTWNNLAYVLFKQGRDQNQALAAAEKAVHGEPTNYHFRETRGQILVKLQRWQEAVSDLEYALNGIPGPGLHAALAEAYQALGKTELAASHRQRAQ